MSGRPDLTASARENVDFPDPAIPVTTTRRCVSWGYMTPSQGSQRCQVRLHEAVCAVVSKLADDLLRHGRIKDARAELAAFSRRHARQVGHRAMLPAIRKFPAASHCCIPAQHATTRPYLPCQRVPRRPGRSRCTRPQTPSAMSSLSNEDSRNGPANASRPSRTILTGRAASASLVRRLHRRTLQPAGRDAPVSEKPSTGAREGRHPPARPDNSTNSTRQRPDVLQGLIGPRCVRTQPGGHCSEPIRCATSVAHANQDASFALTWAQTADQQSDISPPRQNSPFVGVSRASRTVVLRVSISTCAIPMRGSGVPWVDSKRGS